jgi:uncharacterized membrane protein
MSDTDSLNADLAHLDHADLSRLTDVERRIVARFIRRERGAHDLSVQPMTFGNRVADRVAIFGGSWPFIFLALGAIIIWLLLNVETAKPFDPYPFILLNLVLSCLAALQAPIIMMSQSRQAAHDRIDARHDYEVNVKAEMEILALHAKLDEIRDQKWTALTTAQEQQLQLLTKMIAQMEEKKS